MATGDFGTDSATAAVNVTAKTAEKSIDAVIKFLKYLLGSWERKREAEIQKAKALDARMKMDTRKAQLKLQGKAGYVRAKYLFNSGEPITSFKMFTSPEQQQRFAELAKKYNVIFTSVSDITKTGSKEHIFWVRDRDLAAVQDITARITKEFSAKGIIEKINELENKQDKTEQDLLDLQSYRKALEDLEHDNTSQFNAKNANIIFKDVCGQKQKESLSFDRALNHFTDIDYSRDEPYYICERTNPNSYIILNSQRDIFDGQEYTKTDYRVFNNGVEQEADPRIRPDGKFTDERFEGRDKFYWKNLKADMKAKGGFSDDVVIFNSKKEFEMYQQLYNEQQRELECCNIGVESRDYEDIINQLKDQLTVHNADLDRLGFPIDKTTGKVLTYNAENTTEENSRVAECTLIAKQIENYKAIANTEVKIAMLKQSLDDCPVNSEEYSRVSAKITLANQLLNNCLEKEQQLLQQRSQINGTQAVNDVDKAYYVEHEAEQEFSVENEKDNSDTLTMDEWQEEINELRNDIDQQSSVLDKENVLTQDNSMSMEL